MLLLEQNAAIKYGGSRPLITGFKSGFRNTDFSQSILS
jgi:hypothetical protein